MTKSSLKLRILCSIWFAVGCFPVCSQEQEAEPILQLHGGGPATHVASLAFSPDGKTLFGGGWDKVVWVWRKTEDGKFELDTASTFRVPIGPSVQGAVNAIAISPDGKWLAVGGMGVFSGSSGFYDHGKIFPISAMSDEMRLEQGVIHLFNIATRQSHKLRGHRGEILSLEFASASKKSVLVSAAREWDKKNGRHVSRVAVWDVQGRKLLRSSRSFTEPTGRIGLATRSNGKAPDELRVAIAMYDGSRNSRFRLWDVKSNAVSEQTDFSVSVIRHGNQFITGCFGDPVSLRIWFDTAQPLREKKYALRSEADQKFLPYSMTLLRRDLVAVGGLLTKRVGRTDVPYLAQIRLISLANANAGRMLGKTTLWKVNRQTADVPHLATSHEGEIIAIAGSPDEQVLLIRTDELLQSKGQAFQRLHLDANRFAKAIFVKNGSHRGLRLSNDENSTTIFDLDSANVITESLEDWKIDAGDATKSSFKPRPAKKDAKDILVDVKSPGIETTIRIPLGNQPTSAAIYSDKKGDARPLIAMASQNKGQPLLQLFDGRTGKCVRHLSGHTNRIRWVSFSADGRMLVTTGAEQTVCVWNLTDLDQIIGQHGAVARLFVTKTGDHFRVVEPGEAAGVLSKDDLLQGQVFDGRLHGWASEFEFSDMFWKAKPGQEVALRLERKKAKRDVVLKADQGIDERKPLFWLLLKPDVDHISWLAWSPLGVFESSDRQIEKLVGWHFNGVGNEPSLFAPLKQYRNEYYRPHLMKALLDTPDKTPERPIPEPPTLDVSLENSSLDFAGKANRVIGQTSFDVSLNIDPTFPHDFIGSISIKIDDRELGDMAPQDSHRWSMKIENELTDRKTHRLRTTLTTQEQMPRSFHKTVLVRFQPAAPTILVDSVATYHTDKPQFNFKAVIAPGAADHMFVAKLVDDATRRELWNRQSKEILSVDEQISLRPGANRFRLIAHNHDVKANSISEAAHYPFVVHLQVKKFEPPTIVIDNLRSTDVFSNESVLDVAKSTEELFIESPEITLVGRVDSKTEIQKVEIDQGSGLAMVSDFQPNKKQVVIEQKLVIQPGRQELRIVATGQGDVTSVWRKWINYRPVLPDVVPLPLKQGPTITELENGEFEFMAMLDRLPQQSEFDVRIVANDKELPIAVDLETLDEFTILRAKVPMRIDENSIRVLTSNEWQTQMSEPLELNYQPKPTISKVDSRGSFSKIQFEGISDSKISEVRIDGRELSKNDFRVNKTKDNGFELDVDFVPRTAKFAEILPETGPAIKIPIEQPDAIPMKSVPTVEINGPKHRNVVNSSQTSLRYVVKSKSKIDVIEIRNNGELQSEETIQVHQKNSIGEYYYQRHLVVNLKPSINAIQVHARNADGLGHAIVHVNRIFRPVSIMIDGFSYSETGKVELTPTIRSGGKPTFERPTDSGEVWLHGRVRWSNPTDPRLNINRFTVHVWVDGFQQLPIPLARHDGKSMDRRFRTRVVLGRRENVIQISLPQITAADSNTQEFSVFCDKPVQNRRIHLLVISTNEPAHRSKALVDAAIKALNGKRLVDSSRTRRTQFTTPAFGRGDQGIVYGPLTAGQITRQAVMGEINSISREIRAWSQKETANDVVVIYYQGAEVVNRPEGFYLTTFPNRIQNRQPRSRMGLQDRVSSESLDRLFRKSQGAYVLFLDVARRDRVAGGANWPNDSKAAMLRYAWLRGPLAPASASLLEGLTITMARSRRLADIQNGLMNNFAKISKEFPNSMDFDHYLPEPLENLSVGGRTSR